MPRLSIFLSVIGLVLLLAPLAATAQDADGRHKPFIHAYDTDAGMEAAAAEVREKLTGAGFTIVGEYTPYENTVVMAVTSEALLTAVAATDYGAYGAALRVALTVPSTEGEPGEGNIQVTYTNPTYLALAYRLGRDLADVRAALEGALGSEGEYGPDKGLKAKKLGKFRYKPMIMPNFTGRIGIAEYGSHEEAVAKIEEGLAAGTAGTSKVYRIDIPGKEQSVFGVALTRECSGDQHIMTEVDFKPVRSTGHLPYEMLVTGGEVTMLHAKFRIAINFPDLSMMGSHSFMGISCAPNAIRDALREVAGNSD